MKCCRAELNQKLWAALSRNQLHWTSDFTPTVEALSQRVRNRSPHRSFGNGAIDQRAQTAVQTLHPMTIHRLLHTVRWWDSTEQLHHFNTIIHTPKQSRSQSNLSLRHLQFKYFGNVGGYELLNALICFSNHSDLLQLSKSFHISKENMTRLSDCRSVTGCKHAIG